MKTIIAGSRSITSFGVVLKAIKNSSFENEITEVVSGGARGVDSLGESFAKKFSIPSKVFLANWEKYGRVAGVMRNREMADYADALIAIHDGQSKGTLNMIEEANKRNLKVFVFKP